MADEVIDRSPEAGLDAFDNVEIPESFYADGNTASQVDTEGSSTPPEEVATPTADATAPEGTTPEPATVTDAGWQPDGSLKMPNGEIVTAEQVQKMFGGAPDAPVKTQEPPKVDPVMQELTALKEQLAKLTQPQARQEQQFIDPIAEPSEWIRGRAAMLQQQYGPDFKPTWAELQSELALAQGHAHRQQNAQLSQQLQQLQQGIETRNRQTQIEAEIQRIESTGKYKRLETPAGKQVLDMVLRANAGKGEHNLEKGYQDAEKILTSWVMESYAAPKQDKANQVLRSMPRGGGSRPAPKQPKWTGTLEDFDTIGEEIAKG